MQNQGLVVRSGQAIRRLFGNQPQEGKAPRELLPALHPEGRRWTDTIGQDRNEALAAIGAFLADFDLELTQANLAAALAVVSGENMRLRRKLMELALAGSTDRETVAELLQPLEVDGMQEDHLDEMADRLDVTVTRFRDTARSARNAAEQHGLDLESEMQRFSGRDVSLDEFAGWIETSQRILDASRTYEARLRRSEREAQGLRKQLVEIRRLAEVDPLTELPNRRGFEQVFESEIRKANENIEPLAIAFCDVDHFKSINDAWGHDTGDRVLRSIAQQLARQADDKCHAARHGGEEFVMLFRGLEASEARDRLDEVRQAVAQKRFVHEATEQVIGNVTFSAGVANVFAYNSPRDALRAADDALYRAKGDGRNMVLLASAEPDEQTQA